VRYPDAVKVGPVEVDGRELARVCAKWRVRELALFGSATRDDFDEDSDVDLLVAFDPAVRFKMLKMGEIRADFAAVFGRRVDVVERAAVEENPNWVVRRAILESAQRLRHGVHSAASGVPRVRRGGERTVMRTSQDLASTAPSR